MKWRTWKINEGTGYRESLPVVEVIEIGAVRELEAEKQRHFEVALAAETRAEQRTKERDQLRAENERLKALHADVIKTAGEKIERMQELVNYYHDKGYNWQLEAERLRAAVCDLIDQLKDQGVILPGEIDTVAEMVGYSTKESK